MHILAGRAQQFSLMGRAIKDLENKIYTDPNQVFASLFGLCYTPA